MSDLQAAAEAPAPDTSETDAMAAIYDRLAESAPAEPAAEAPEPATEAAEAPAEAEAAEPAPEPQEAAPEAPTGLPQGIRAKWADLPEPARDELTRWHDSLNRRMAEQGRVVQAAKPVFDVLVKAAQEIPTLADMTPDQIARDVFSMAQLQSQFAQKPVQTLIGIAQQHGALDALRQALAGASPDKTAQENIALAQELRQLRAQLQKVADPNAIDERVTQTITMRETQRMVEDYARSKDHWGDVESVIPQMIPLAKQRLGSSASAQDVLDAAYDMAIHAIPDLRAKVAAAAQAPAAADPARTAAQVKAKSVNVRSTASGQPKPASEREALERVWDKYRG
jgi:hypothetical protein